VSEVEVLYFEDAAAVAEAAAASCLLRLAQLLAEKPEVHLMVTGGTVGIATLAAMATSPLRSSVDFRHVHFWWGDERFVAKESKDRNELQARVALLSKIAVDEKKVHAFPAAENGLALEEAAEIFKKELSKFASSDRAYPHFDLVFLGMGPDGHVASLFPGGELPKIGETIVAEHDSPKPPSQRLSFSYEVLNSADSVWFTVAGLEKAAAVAIAFGESFDALPAGRVKGTLETVWFLDAAAAGEL